MAAPLYRSSFAARAGQQPDVILKDASSAEQQQVVFNPHKEVTVPSSTPAAYFQGHTFQAYIIGRRLQ